MLETIASASFLSSLSIIHANSNTILLLYAGDIRVPPRVPASGPEPCGGNNNDVSIVCARKYEMVRMT